MEIIWKFGCYTCGLFGQCAEETEAVGAKHYHLDETVGEIHETFAVWEYAL